MENSNLKSLTGQVESLYKTDKDFPQKFKHRLVRESSNSVTNHFELIAHLYNEGLLCHGSNDSEATVGLKEMMVQLAFMIACSKGAEATGSLMKALEGSGNLALISALQTWINDEFSGETGGDLSEAKELDSVVRTSESEMVAQVAKNTLELWSIGSTLTDKIMTRMDDDFMEQLEGHWVGQASKIVNIPKFCSSLTHQEVLNESDLQQRTGIESEQDQWAENVIRAALAKRAIASLVLAFQLSGNQSILQETHKWLETSQVRKNNYPIADKSLPNQLQPQKSKHVMSQFFEQAPPLNDLEKVATFNCSPETFTKGKFALKFSQEKMMARFSGGTVKLWNWRQNQETTIKFADKVKDLTALHYDEEIVVLGTAAGTVHLFDAGTLEEKWLERLGEPVHSLKLVKSTLVVLTRNCNEDKLWWMELSRSNMRLLNRRPMLSILKNKINVSNNAINVSKKEINGFLEDRYCFVWVEDVVKLYDSKTGKILTDDFYNCAYSLEAPAEIKTLNVVDLIGGTPFVVAGCKDGVIAIWNMNSLCANFGPKEKPAKSLKGHQGAIIDLTAINGHLLSVCKGGKLLLWSGRDLQNQHVVPIPRVLSENFSNVTCLVAHERWFVSTSSQDGIINVWAIPDLWLRTG